MTENIYYHNQDFDRNINEHFLACFQKQLFQ